MVQSGSLGVAPVLWEVFDGLDIIVDDGMLFDAGADDSVAGLGEDIDQRLDGGLLNEPGRGFWVGSLVRGIGHVGKGPWSCVGFTRGEGGRDRGVAGEWR